MHSAATRAVYIHARYRFFLGPVSALLRQISHLINPPARLLLVRVLARRTRGSIELERRRFRLLSSGPRTSSYSIIGSYLNGHGPCDSPTRSARRAVYIACAITALTRIARFRVRSIGVTRLFCFCFGFAWLSGGLALREQRCAQSAVDTALIERHKTSELAAKLRNFNNE